ncbi:MAG: ABC transporter permease [Fimbriimonadaceae bacterium]
MRFERTLAWRYILSGGGQTILIMSAVAIGVVLMVIVRSILMGCQQHLTDEVADVLPHITISSRTEIPTLAIASAYPVSTRVQKRRDQTKNLDQWEKIVSLAQRTPGVAGAAPAILEQGFVSFGGKRIGATLQGVDPESADNVIRVSKYTYQGRYLGLGPAEAVVNYQVVKELGVSLGSRIRIASPAGVSYTFAVVGLFDSGSQSDFPRAFVNLRAAQSLYRTGPSVPTVLVRVNELFSADEIAIQLRRQLSQKVESWMEKTPLFADTLKSFQGISFLLSGLALIASAFAVASVLIVSVAQKGRQIGILKSMGVKSHQIFRAFVLQGAFVSSFGAVVGAAMAVLAVGMLEKITVPPTHPGAVLKSQFPSGLSWQLLIVSVAVVIVTASLASAMPARRAARLNPVETMK